MSDPLAGQAAALRRVADELGEAVPRFADVDPGGRAFGAAAAGAFGAVAEDLHAQLRAALRARAAETGAMAAEVQRLAGAVAQAATGYADIDHSSGRRGSDVR